jgi:hypothetical protein
LIPKFVEYDDITQTSTACLCLTCSNAINAKRIPTYSLANGVDYGAALEFHLEELTIPEQYLIALGRVYGTVLKLSGNQNDEKQAAFTGHMITFAQPDDVLLTEISRINKTTSNGTYPLVDDLHLFLSVIFVGARQQWDAFVPTSYSKIPEIQVNAQKIYKYLRVLKALHPAYCNIIFDDSDAMSEKLNNIPTQLLYNAQVIQGDMERRIDGIAQEDCNNETTAVNGNIHFPDLPTVFVTHTTPPPTDVNQPSASFLKSKLVITYFISYRNGCLIFNFT